MHSNVSLHQLEASSCHGSVKLEFKKPVGPFWVIYIESSFNHLSRLTNVFCELPIWWMRGINPTDLGNIPRGVPVYLENKGEKIKYTEEGDLEKWKSIVLKGHSPTDLLSVFNCNFNKINNKLWISWTLFPREFWSVINKTRPANIININYFY